eukprot:5831100-Pyramimonas_sp.AAC.1
MVCCGIRPWAQEAGQILWCSDKRLVPLVAKRGEDYAMLMVSRQVLGSYTVLSDCKGTLAYSRSPNLAVGAGNPRAN